MTKKKGKRKKGQKRGPDSPINDVAGEEHCPIVVIAEGNALDFGGARPFFCLSFLLWRPRPRAAA